VLNEVQAAIREILDAIQNRDDLTKEDTRLDEPGKFLYGIDLVKLSAILKIKNENECCFYFYEHLCQICSFFSNIQIFFPVLLQIDKTFIFKIRFFVCKILFFDATLFFHLFCLKCMIKNFLSEGLMKN